MTDKKLPAVGDRINVLDAVKAHGHPIEGEVTYIHRDGAICLTTTSGWKIRIRSGRPISIVSLL